jgi:hypothetical protein
MLVRGRFSGHQVAESDVAIVRIGRELQEFQWLQLLPFPEYPDGSFTLSFLSSIGGLSTHPRSTLNSAHQNPERPIPSPNLKGNAFGKPRSSFRQ